VSVLLSLADPQELSRFCGSVFYAAPNDLLKWRVME
jgi:hypothetical protein